MNNAFTKLQSALLIVALLQACTTNIIAPIETSDCASPVTMSQPKEKITIQVDGLTPDPAWIISVKDDQASELKMHPVTSSFTIQAAFVNKGQDYTISFFLCGKGQRSIPITMQIFQSGKPVTILRLHTDESTQYTVQ